MAGPKDYPLGIPDDTRLFRRIDPNQIIYDANRKERRPTSQCFDNSRDDLTMSVFAENIAQANGEDPADFLKGRWEDFYLVAVTARWMRQNGQDVYPDPHNQDPDEYFNSHSAVWGQKPSKRRKKLAYAYG